MYGIKYVSSCTRDRVRKGEGGGLGCEECSRACARSWCAGAVDDDDAMEAAGAALAHLMRDRFSPVVMVLSTPRAEESCRKNHLGFVDLLRPFSVLDQINGMQSRFYFFFPCWVGEGLLLGGLWCLLHTPRFWVRWAPESISVARQIYSSAKGGERDSGMGSKWLWWRRRRFVCMQFPCVQQVSNPTGCRISSCASSMPQKSGNQAPR